MIEARTEQVSSRASGYNLDQIGFRIGNQFLTISFLMAIDRFKKHFTQYYQTNEL